MGARDLRDLAGRSALVTGASQGIGRGIAHVLARRGASVWVNSRTTNSVEGVVQEIRLSGGSVQPAVGSVLDMKWLRKQAADIVAASGSLDILVNNAVAPSRSGPFAESDPEEWELDLGVGLRGYMMATRAVLGPMLEQGSGGVINISSSAGKVGSPNLVAYSAAKGGVIAFTKALARELADTGVRVNSVAPGATNTPMQDRLSDEFKAYMRSTIPAGRYGEPEEVGEMVAFLASDAAAYVLGQTFSVDGGRTMQ